MGMYDSVMVPCPNCGERVEFQSKSGDCLLNVYDLETCPSDVLGDVNRHSPYDCPKCSTVFKVDLKISAQSVKAGETPR
jgi:hypothetical protein